MPTPAYYQEVYDAAKRLTDRGEKPTYKAISAESGWCKATVWRVISHFRRSNSWPFKGGKHNRRVDPLAKREAVKLYQAGVPMRRIHRHLSKRYKISLSTVMLACGRKRKNRRTEDARIAEQERVRAAADRIKQRGDRASFAAIATETGWGVSKVRRIGYQLQAKGCSVTTPHPNQRRKKKKESGPHFERLTPTEIRERAAQIRAERRD